jgi:sec-independent protein translocase protein TatA
MARSLGRSLRIFKTEIKGMSQDDKARQEAEAAAEPAGPRELQPGPTANPPANPMANPMSKGGETAPLPRADVVRNRPRPTPGNGPAAQPSEPSRSVGQ